jgi:Lipoprotein LpqB beta-propeller domain/Sporulation and spore germination
VRPPAAPRRPPLALRAGLIAAALMVGLISGCSGFPDRGPVTAARRLEASGTSLEVFAAPPAPGAGPRAIVRGFLQAGFDFHQDHRVAREYVSTGRTQWQAEAPVVVLDSATLDVTHVPPSSGPGEPVCRGPSASAGSAASPAPAVSPGDGDTVMVCVSGQQLARVDDAGLMHMASPSGASDDRPSFSRLFTLEARHGEWRIVRPRDGLVLTRTEFEDTFRALPLYFPDSSGRWLVPDVRWFPVLDRGDITPTAALEVSTLLRGAAGWLAPALSPTVPRGTSLTPVGSVQIDSGTARIDLSHRVHEAKPEQRLLLRAQLLATLQALSQQGFGTISDVVLTAEQAKLEVPDGVGPRTWSAPAVAGLPKFGRDDAASYGQSPPLCLTDKSLVGQLGRTPKGQPACSARDDLTGLAKPGLALATSDVAGKVFAGLVSGGARVVATTPGRPAQTALTGTALTAPSVDGHGWIWSSPGTSPGWVLAGALGGGPVRVEASWLRGQRVLALRLSPEGARALLLVGSGAASRSARPTFRAVVAGVVRDASGRPRSLSGPGLAVLPDLTSAVDAGWSDTDQVVVLGARRSPSGLYAWRVAVGGEAGTLLDRPLPRTAAGLAVGIGDLLDVFVRTSDGKAVVSSLGSWQPIGVKGLTLPS